MSHRAIVSRRAVLSWGAVSLATLVSSCAGLPTNDRVTQHSSGLDVKSVNTSPARAPGPLAGATPEAIIEGFVRAGVDSIENYAVARQYLSSSFAGRWNPMGTTRVYRNTVQARSDDSGHAEGMYHVRFQQTATVNSQGITSTFPEAQTETHDFTMVMEDNQWRINSCPDGLWLDGTEFERVFSPCRLYFYDRAFRYAVPDIRWFPHTDRYFELLVRTLMAGPASYLKDVAFSALNESMSLETANMSDNQDVLVRLSGERLDDNRLARVREQIMHGLENFSGLGKTEVFYNGTLIPENAPSGFSAVKLNPGVPARTVAINSNGQMVARDDYMSNAGEQLLLRGVSQLSSPAMGYSADVYACLANDAASLYTVYQGTARRVWQSTALTAPSFDAYGWVWAADGEGIVRAFKPDSEDATERERGVDIGLSWQRNLSFTSVNISHDGARMAIVASTEGASAVIISGIVRDDAGKPLRLTEMVRLSSSVTPRNARWAGDQSVVVVNVKNGESEVISLSGEETKLDRLDGVMTISTADNTSNIIAHRSDGSCYLMEERGWIRLDTALHEISYAG
ncbi:LpqB family beta-propeller domain-containing protein [Rothia mucilaginosa]|uniref:LpqB family beta-propeller domain-containing protein n=1 Tax=Rothia mucilaginosa TaxID=43675 RepID=UPI003C7DEF8D